MKKYSTKLNCKKPHNRREFLMGVSVVGGSVLGYSGVVSAAATTQIPIVKHQGRVLQSAAVPREWWNYEQHVDAVAAQLRADHRDTSSVDGVGLQRSSRRVAGRYTSQPLLYIAPESDQPPVVPQTIDGVPIASRSTPAPEPDDCYLENYHYVPGGVQVEHDNHMASTTCPVTKDGTHALMTAAHLFSQCTTEVIGDRLSQSGQFVGVVSDRSIRQDWAIVPLADNAHVTGFNNTIAGTVLDVMGYVTRCGLKHLMATNTTVYKNGRSTCQTQGTVTALDVSIRLCSDTKNEQVSRHFVQTSTHTEDGDSGAPHYHTFRCNGDQKAAIIAPHYGGESIGCAAYRIVDEHTIDFGMD